MTTLASVLRHKGSEVCTIQPGRSVRDAARLMNEHRIGALLVLGGDVDDHDHDPHCTISGIFTERDILVRIVAPGLDPSDTHVGAVMTRDIITATPQTAVEDARKIFRSRRIRHLPVLDDGGHLAGMVSIGDLSAHDLADSKVVITALETLLYERT